MNDVRSVTSGMLRRIFSMEREEYVGAAAALHALQHGGRGVLQRHVNVGTDLLVRGDGFQQACR